MLGHLADGEQARQPAEALLSGLKRSSSETIGRVGHRRQSCPFASLWGLLVTRFGRWLIALLEPASSVGASSGDGTPSPTANKLRNAGLQYETPAAPLPDMESTNTPQSPKKDVSARYLADLAGKVVAPTSLLAALAYHFGREMTLRRTSYFGIDPSLLGFSAQDYVVRSADALFIPLGALALTGLIALPSHLLVLWLSKRYSPRLISGGAWVLLAVGVALLGFGSASALTRIPILSRYLLAPLSPGLGVLLVWYSVYLITKVTPTVGIVSLKRATPAWVGSVAMILVLSITVLSLFWAATEYAHALGRGRARALAQDLASLPDTTIYAKGRLFLVGPGVTEERISEASSAYAFRYSGLRFFIRSNGKHFLLPDRWSRTAGSAIVLDDNAEIRLEFRPGGSVT